MWMDPTRNWWEKLFNKLLLPELSERYTRLSSSRNNLHPNHWFSCNRLKIPSNLPVCCMNYNAKIKNPKITTTFSVYMLNSCEQYTLPVQLKPRQHVMSRRRVWKSGGRDGWGIISNIRDFDKTGPVFILVEMLPPCPQQAPPDLHIESLAKLNCLGWLSGAKIEDSDYWIWELYVKGG